MLNGKYRYYLVCLSLLLGASVGYAGYQTLLAQYGKITRGPGRGHAGYDFPTSRGAPVNSLVSGIVSVAGHRSGYGKTVAIYKSNGCNEIYAHLNTIHVREGQQVSSGTSLGTAGATGRVALSLSTAVLHWEPCSRLYKPGSAKSGIKGHQSLPEPNFTHDPAANTSR